MLKNIRFIVASTVFFFLMNSYTVKSNKYDSLKLQLSKTTPVENIDIYLEIAELFRFENLDSTLSYLIKAKEMGEEYGNDEQFAKTYSLLGEVYFNQADYTNAWLYYNEASEAYRSLNQPLNEAKGLSFAGNSKLVVGDLETALNSYIKSFEIFESLNDTSGIIYAYTSIGQVYSSLRDFPKGELNYQKAFKLAEMISDSAAIARLWNNQGMLYLETKELNKASDNLQLAQKYFKKSGNTWAELSVLNNIAILHDYTNNYDEAIPIYYNIISYSDSLGDKLGVALANSNLGDICTKTFDFETANDYYLKSLELAFEIKKPDLIRNLYEKLSVVSREQNNAEAALDYLEKHIVFKDSVFTIEKNNQILKMQNRFDLERKENEILVLQKEKDAEEIKRKTVLIIFIFTFIVSVLIIVLLRYKMSKNKKIRQQEKKLHHQEQELSKAELDKKILIEKQLQEKIKHADKQLTTSALNIIQKNELMIELKNRLENLSHEKTTDIKSLINYNFKLDNDWQEFQYYFEQVHKDFYLLLKKDYPDLSPTELKITALIKLNFSIKQTASIMGITSDSVKTYRSRI